MSYSGHALCAGCGGAIMPGPRITVPGIDGSWHLHCPEHAWMAVEREACAKIVDLEIINDSNDQRSIVAAKIASKIRLRSEL